MVENELGVQEREFISIELDGTHKKQGGNFIPIYEDTHKHGHPNVLEYLNSVCLSDVRLISEHPNFFDGEVLAHVSYSRIENRGENYPVTEGPFKYREHVKIKWQPKNKEPSNLIKVLTKQFGLF